MAEPARKINDNKGKGDILKDRAADDYIKINLKLVPKRREQESESQKSALIRQNKQKARQDLDPKNKITNLDDYRARGNQIRQAQETQPKQSVPALDLNERLRQKREGGEEGQIQGQNPFEGGSVDENLLRQLGSEEDETEPGKNKEEDDKETSASKLKREKLRDRIKKKIAEKATKKAGAALGKATGMDLAGQGPKKLLQAAWRYAIPTFGLTVITYVNIHVFCRWVFGEEYFCKLGDEWISANVKAAAGGKTEKISNKIGLVEILILLILDLIVLFAILTQLAFLAIIIQFMTASLWEKVKSIWTIIKAGKDMVWGSIKALYDLFKNTML